MAVTLSAVVGNTNRLHRVSFAHMHAKAYADQDGRNLTELLQAAYISYARVQQGP